MKTVHMLIGIPGSGKSTYSKKVLLSKLDNAILVSSDQTRNDNPELTEDEIWPEIYRLCAKALSENHDLIFDATNITPKTRKRFFDEMEKRNIPFDSYDKIAYYFEADPNLCIERVIIRNKDPKERPLPLEVINDYYQNQIKPTKEEGFSNIVIIENYSKEKENDL